MKRHLLAFACACTSVGIRPHASSLRRRRGSHRQALPEFLYAINGFKSDGKFRTPCSVAVDQSGNLVYVCDMEDKLVCAFSLQGSAKFRIGEKGELDDPVAVAVDRHGNLYVTERRARKIKVFDRRYNLASVIDLGSRWTNRPKSSRAG